MATSRRQDRTWRAGLDQRLRQLIRAHGPSQAAFAKQCGIDAPRVTAWLSGETHPSRAKGKRTPKASPSAAHLRAISESCGVSLDWLLFGDGGDEPIYRGQSRTRAELEHDIGAYLVRAIRAAVQDLDAFMIEGALSADMMDVPAILADVADRLADEARWLFHYARANAESVALGELVTYLARGHSPAEENALLAELGRITGLANNDRRSITPQHSKHYLTRETFALALERAREQARHRDMPAVMEAAHREHAERAARVTGRLRIARPRKKS